MSCVCKNDVSPVKRVCYKAVRHVREPETLHVRDSVVVKALDGTCNYGKVTRIFLDEDSGLFIFTKCSLKFGRFVHLF
ncbi:unnamed protein product [Anisakis simplex]|uniref:Tudor domain-containing protein n=1 Tax=Anisakis simplex TaxID=6269 RepID=A0A0M3JLG7_ANISI|nr:unnamed protein product [Anisakis simplex]